MSFAGSCDSLESRGGLPARHREPAPRLTSRERERIIDCEKEMAMSLRGIFRRKPRDVSERTCLKCDHYGSGHIDRRANWCRCGKGHRLIAEEELVHEYRPYEDPDEPVVRVTQSGWSGGTGFGEPMLGRTDCPDWKKRRFRIDLGNPEYD
ncbi:MAG: hypothetical protein MUF10_02715 [Thermoanaerobaculaceae bacterium]|nr:hypothetical protein [Thermoanaerobaculaceae bacterium]